jgi:hypothetical protein
MRAFSSFRSAVLASFVEAAILEVCGSHCAQQSDESKKTVAFLVDQQDALPHILGPLMKLATVIFGVSTLFVAGRPFHYLPVDRRVRYILAWRKSRIQAVRNFVKFHETFAAFHVQFARHSAGAPTRVALQQPAVHPAVGDGMNVDVAIIGSGPGGSVTALRCAEAGLSVLLIEEGSLLSPGDTIEFSPDEMRRKVRNNGLTIGLGTANVAYWEGRCVGGGSEVNRGLYHRPLPEVLEAWARDFEIDALTVDDLAIHTAACESIVKVSYLPGPAPANSRKLADGAAALGWRHVEVPRLFSYAADWQTGAPGVKQSMSATLVPLFVNAGGRLVCNARVDRLVRDNGRWLLSADVADGEGRRATQFRARTVFVACGAVESAALLKRSGIRRRVGDTLAFHPMVKASARFSEPVSADTRLDPVHQVKHFDPRFSLGASVSTPSTLTLAMTDRPGDMIEIERHWQFMAAYYAQTTGGRGSVRVLPGFRDPLVRVQPDPVDMADLAEGLRRLCECLFAAGAEIIYPNLANCPALRSMDDLCLLPETLTPDRVSLSTLHLFSSCPMGGRREQAVADSFGMVYDAEDLYLAGAALLPSPTVVNPQGSVMAMAHRNVTHFLEGKTRKG